jgi:hypothetical protein
MSGSCEQGKSQFTLVLNGSEHPIREALPRPGEVQRARLMTDELPINTLFANHLLQMVGTLTKVMYEGGNQHP